jgi:hypothetical protein
LNDVIQFYIFGALLLIAVALVVLVAKKQSSQQQSNTYHDGNDTLFVQKGDCHSKRRGES